MFLRSGEWAREGLLKQRVRKELQSCPTAVGGPFTLDKHRLLKKAKGLTDSRLLLLMTTHRIIQNRVFTRSIM